MKAVTLDGFRDNAANLHPGFCAAVYTWNGAGSRLDAGSSPSSFPLFLSSSFPLLLFSSPPLLFSSPPLLPPLLLSSRLQISADICNSPVQDSFGCTDERAVNAVSVFWRILGLYERLLTRGYRPPFRYNGTWHIGRAADRLFTREESFV